MKTLTPDLRENVHAASRAAQDLTNLASNLWSPFDVLQTNPTILQRSGQKAEKLDFCVQRLEEIRRTINGMEIGSLCAITIKNLCEELWQKIP